ncbi:MAG: transporter [Marmoricola sp.]|jgi:MFS family permease|nr:transporter [Marmoricola sp.]
MAEALEMDPQTSCSTAKTGATGSMRAALANPAFRRLVIALTTSQAGDWLYNVALLAFVYERTHSAAWLSATTAIRVLPIVLLGPLGGVVADRFDRRRTMIVCDLVRAGLMLTLVLVAVLELPTILAPVVAGLATAASAPYPPCTAASVPRLVPDEDLAAANAVRAVVGPLCIVLGPALGALLLLAGPVSLIFAVNAGTFVVSAVVVASLHAGAPFRPSRRTQRSHLLAEMAEGAGALWCNRFALRLVSADLVCSFLYGVETVALVLVSSRLGLSDQGYGLLLAAAGAGGVLGSVLAPRVARAGATSRVIAVMLVVAAVPLALMPLMPSLPGVLLLAALMGAASMLVEVSTETVLQRTLDDAVFGRAYGFAFPASIAGIAIGAAVAAPLIAWWGLVDAMLLVGVTAVGYAIVLCLPGRRSRQVI